MIKAILIDDEPLARSIVKEYLLDYPEVVISQECGDGFEGVKAIAEHKPDLIFLDIQMPKINGFEMLELIEQEPAVIFTTAFDEYAIKAFDVHAIDYLLKPFSKDRFGKAMEKLINQHKAHIGGTSEMQGLLEEAAQQKVQQERVVVRTGAKIKIIPVQDIHYLEADDDYVKIHTHEGRFLKKKTMGYFEASLPASQFVRTHRSYIVQVQQITRIEPYEKESHLAILKSGAKIPISAAGYSKLKVVLGL